MKNRLKLIAAIVVIVGFVALSRVLPVSVWLEHFVLWVHNMGVAGAFVFAAAYIAGTVFLMPGTVLTAGSGLLYGTLIGTLIVSPASVIGATISFLIARTFGRDWVGKKLANYPKFSAIDRAVERHGFKVVLLMRLEPVFIPFALLNYALGLTKVRMRDYILASWIGMLPATVLYVYIGTVIHDLSQLVRGHLPSSGILGRVLLWGGLGVTVLLVLLLVRIAHRALTAELQVNAENWKELETHHDRARSAGRTRRSVQPQTH